ncbi:MAG TPA: ArdC family protein, partial [Flavobacterium sp.]|nr:ArdC family protein [Flavobacterium sp.]
MKTVQSRFHSLSNRVAKRAEIVSILEQAKQEKHHDIVKRLSALLDQYPSANVFELTIKKARSMRAVTSRRRIKTDDVQIEEDIVFFGLDEISEDEAAGLGKVSPADVYQMITDMMINTIKTVGHLPWQKEWTGQGEGGLLRNYVTNKPYRGINQILLSFEQKIADGKRILVPIKFQQPYYLTMNQIKDQGAQLKKGSKASIAVYYSAVYTYDDGKLKFKTSDKAKFLAFVRSNGLTATDLENHATQYRFLKYYNVFRADDCIGLKPKKPAKQTSGGRKVTPIEACQ